MSRFPRPASRRRLRTAARVPATLFVPLLVILALLATGCGGPKRVLRATPPPPTTPGGPVLVRIGMIEGAQRVALTCDGPWRLRTPALAEGLPLAAGDSLVLQRVGAGVAVADSLLVGAATWLAAVPDDPAHVLQWDDRPWRGEFQVFATPDSVGLTAINVLELERYLAGVVPREIGGGRERTDFAAVAAQAVAARNYTLGHLARREARGFDLHADVRDQAYGGVAWEDSLCNEALRATAGLVLLREGELVRTYYHSTCGGHTASIAAVWPYADDPALRGRPDRRPDGRPWCAASRYATWRQVWTWDELNAIVARTLPAYVTYARAPGREAWGADVFRPATADASPDAPGHLCDLVVRSRDRDGRVTALLVRTAAGEYLVRGDRTRWVLRPPEGGPWLLRSACFELTVEPGRRVVAEGRGWGHGLGLCQMGALGRARAGQGFREILAHYYPGAHLAPVRDGEVLP